MRGIVSFIAATLVVAFGNGFPLARRGSSQQTVLTLAAGPISGIKVASNNYKFLGIPYAQPPTGDLRLASPVPYPRACMSDPYASPIRSANRSINATAFGNICPQATGGAEDCLTLNIFTGTVFPLGLRPVMFWYYTLAILLTFSGFMEEVLFSGLVRIRSSTGPTWRRITMSSS
jgi:para-nitrobenzyl esterase